MTSVSSFQGMMVSMSSRNCSLRVFLRYFSKPSVRVGCRMFSDSQRFLVCGIIAKNHRRINQSFLNVLVEGDLDLAVLVGASLVHGDVAVTREGRFSLGTNIDVTIRVAIRQSPASCCCGVGSIDGIVDIVL